MDISPLIAVKGIVLAVLAFGLMIFVHELGHFLAAKLMGVRVEKFSFGMGPKLVGRQWGQTDYRISAIPVGGYVWMAGGDEGQDAKGAPDEFISKSPGRRAFIIAAGPVFSVLFGLPLMMGVYLIGLEVPVARVSDVVIGSPAWDAGVRCGDRIQRLGDERIYTFDELRIAAVESPPDTPIALVVERDGREVPLSVLRPHGKQELGISCMFQSPRVARVVPASPAAKAGIQPDDVLETVNGKPIRGWSDFRRHILAHPGKTVAIGIERGGKRLTLQATPDAGAVKDPGFTIRLPREIGFVRKGFPAAGKLEVGDRIVGVNGADVAGWWDIEDAAAEGTAQVALAVERGGESLTVQLERGAGTRLTDTLGIAPRPVYVVADVHGATDPQVAPGDEIVKAAADEVQEAIRERGLLYVPLADILRTLAKGGKITVRRGEEELVVTLEPTDGTVGQLGIEGSRDVVVRKETLVGSVVPALKKTAGAAKLVYVILRKLTSGDVKGSAIAGPLGILQITYAHATRGWADLLYLVGMITVNIGVVNLVPIPLLDGGRLVFLGYEKVRGKAPNRRVQEVMMIASVAFLVVVLVWVTKNDIVRIIHQLKRGLL